MEAARHIDCNSQAQKEQSSALPPTPRRTKGVFYGIRLFSGTAGWRW